MTRRMEKRRGSWRDSSPVALHSGRGRCRIEAPVPGKTFTLLRSDYFRADFAAQKARCPHDALFLPDGRARSRRGHTSVRILRTAGKKNASLGARLYALK